MGHKIATFTSVLILLIGAGLYGVVIYQGRLTAHELSTEKSLEYVKRTSSLIDDHLYALDVRELRHVVSSIMENGDLDLVWVLDEEGRLLTDGSNKPALRNQKPPIPFINALIAAKTELHGEGDVRHWSGEPVFVGDDTLLGYVVVAFSLEHIDERLRSLLISQLIVLGPALLIGVLAAFFFGRRITKPLETVSAVAEQIGAGNWDVDIHIDSKDEVGELARSINAMAKNLSQIAVSRDSLESIVGEKTVELNMHREHLEGIVKTRTSELSEALKIAEVANQAKSEFLSTMSHELRTPMNAILGFGQILELNPKEPLSDGQKFCVDHIMGGGKHLLELINQVLDLVKIETGKMTLSVEQVQLNELCQECLSLIDTQAEKRGLRIDSNLGAVNYIKADYTRFKQVLLNLLSNAVKYNREGGTITLTCKEVPDNMMRVSVTDSGEGIAKGEQIKLFQPFNRLGHEAGEIEGTGIGLTITKQLIEAMNGRVGFESEVGEGSTFWVEIPAIKTAVAELTSSVPKESDLAVKSTINATVLYIEDNPANLQLMETIISRIGNLTMISAHTAELGLTMAEEKLPDLILMDINLPGMDGIAAMQVLSTIDITKNIPVIAISAAAMKSDINRGMSAGFKAYLTKPFSVPEVIEAIKKELDA